MKEEPFVIERTFNTPVEKVWNAITYDGYSGISFITFELFPIEGKTRLKLTHAGLENFPG
jgi:hypothetical protein